MKVGLMGDSHGNTDFVETLIEWFTKSKFQKIIHLGDDYEDVGKYAEIIKVPGVFSDLYKNPKIPNRLIFEFEGWKVLLSHTKESHENDLPTDLKPEDVIKSKEAEVILFAHTHIPAIEKEGGIIYINPGHLKITDKKKHPPSFGILDFENSMLGAKIADFKTKTPIFAKFFVK